MRISYELFLFALLLTIVRSEKWSLVIDAGSSGSRMRIFKLTHVEAQEQSMPRFEQFLPQNETEQDALEMHPGLSSFANNLTLAKIQIETLVGLAAKYVPESKQATTPVRLGATAGLRLVSTADQNALIGAVEEVLTDAEKCPFAYISGDARVLSGEEEATFGWLSANYIAGNFAGTQPTLGIMDLGGASTQIAFEPTNQIMEEQFAARIEDRLFRIYATSYLKYGNDQFKKIVAQKIAETATDGSGTEADPYATPCQCTDYTESVAIGSDDSTLTYFKGTGEWDTCKNVTRELLYQATPCFFEDPSTDCALNGKYMAAVSGNFLAISEFFYTANGLGLVGWKESKGIALNEIETSGKAWCLNKTNAESSSFAPDFCRNSAYIVSLLHDAYGFEMSDEETVTYTRKLNGFDVDWTLGMVIYAEEAFRTVSCGRGTMIDPEDDSRCIGISSSSDSSKNIGEGVGIGIGACFGLILIGGAAYYVVKRRREDEGDAYRGI